MAVRWIEGFEMERVVGHLSRRYVVSSGSYAPQQVGRKNINGWAMESSDAQLVTAQMTTALQNTWTAQLGVRFLDDSAGWSVDFPGMHLLDGPSQSADQQIGVRFVGDALVGFETAKVRIEVVRGSTILGTSDVRLAQDRWYFIEFQVTVHPTTGSYEVRVDGSVDSGASDTSGTVNTANQGTAGADHCHLSWNISNADNVQYDDWLVKDDGVYLGDTVIEGLETDAANGATNDWAILGAAATTGDALNDNPGGVGSGDETTMKLQSELVGDISLAPTANLVLIRDGTVHALEVRVLGRMETSGQRDVQPRVRDTTATPGEANGMAHTFMDTPLELFREVFVQNPVRSLAWTIPEIDGAEWGVRVDA